ncbi:MAG: hypothetical protein LUF01_01585 [Bacteroides sp.]|nr:hypothetical protein [Bacteroides sp.]
MKKNAPNYATYIELIGSYTSSGSAEASEMTYVIYLGDGYDVNNYDVQRNHSYQIIANIKGKNTTSDLRVTDYINLSADGLANCYLASKDNHKYCFNGTVRGNGNAEDHAALQYPGQGVSLMPSKVVDSAPDAVTIPAGEIKEAFLVWETAAGIISNVKWNEASGRVNFETGTVKGNAMIAVRNASGKILWSWHIWRTNGVGLKELDESYKVKMQTSNKRFIYVMDRNIGSNFVSIPPSYADCTGGNGLYYQFGRKDPFPGTYSSTTGEQHKFSNTPSPGSTAFMLSIEKPFLFYWLNSVPYNWISSAKLNSTDWKMSNCLWGDNSKNSGNIIDQEPWDGKKTIYDPSPAGWRVAPADTWTGILKSNYSFNNTFVSNLFNYINVVGGFSNGYTVYSVADENRYIYLCATGYYGYDGGTQVSYGKEYGYGWLSSPGGSDSTDAAYLSIFRVSLIGIVGKMYRAFGFPVRCVKE